MDDYKPEAGEAPLQTVPPQVRTVLQVTLGGPLAYYVVPAPYAVRLWMMSTVVIGFCGGVISRVAKENGPHLWVVVGWVGQIVLPTLCTALSEMGYGMAMTVGCGRPRPGQEAAARCCRKLGAQGLLDVESGEGARRRPPGEIDAAAAAGAQDTATFLHMLLGAEVSAGVAKRITDATRNTMLGACVPMVMVLAQMTAHWLRATGAGVAADHPSTYEQERFAMTILVLILPLSSMAFGGVLLFLRVPALVVCDLIQRSAGRVRQMGKRTPSEDDFNQIMGLIQEAHELTVRLSGLLAPVRVIKPLLAAGS